MPFEPKDIKKKPASGYKTIYISENLINEIEKLAKESDTSFNNVVVSMIERCLKKE